MAGSGYPRSQISKYQNIKISGLRPQAKNERSEMSKNDLFRNVQTDGLAKTIGRRGQNPYIRFGDFTPLAKYRMPQVLGSGHPRSQISEHQNMKISGLRPLPMVLARPRLLAFREMSFLDIPGRPFLARALSPDILIFWFSDILIFGLGSCLTLRGCEFGLMAKWWKYQTWYLDLWPSWLWVWSNQIFWEAG